MMMMITMTILSCHNSPRLGPGKLDKDGREAIKLKYFLSPRQFNRLAPPTLEDSKLYMINNMEFGGLSDRLLRIHR